MKLKPLRNDLLTFLEKRGLSRKWEKAARLFQINMRHPSLHTELLEPRWRGVYSFRVDLAYRALFVIDATGETEVFAITKHYKK